MALWYSAMTEQPDELDPMLLRFVYRCSCTFDEFDEIP